MDIIPRDLVLQSSCYWGSNSKNQSSIKSSFQKLQDLISFSVIRKKSSTLGTVVPSARVRMFPALTSRWKIVVDHDCTTICRSITYSYYSCYCNADTVKWRTEKIYNKSEPTLMLVLLYVQHGKSCPVAACFHISGISLSNCCEAECTLVDASNAPSACFIWHWPIT